MFVGIIGWIDEEVLRYRYRLIYLIVSTNFYYLSNVIKIIKQNFITESLECSAGGLILIISLAHYSGEHMCPVPHV